ncbi:MAG: hypothetical protein JWO06_3545, partial [Bacteroidota bacterium]|nr:hypothetical protein [Bacteroidota bacterium]
KEREKQDGAGMTGIESGSLTSKSRLEVKPDIAKEKGKELGLQYDTIYRIQFYALRKYLPLDTNYYPHLKGYDVYEDSGLFKYVLGEYRSYKACYDYWKGQIQPRYKESFIVKFINGKRVLK